MNKSSFKQQKSNLLGIKSKTRIGEVSILMRTSSPALIGFTVAAGLAFWWMILG